MALSFLSNANQFRSPFALIPNCCTFSSTTSPPPPPLLHLYPYCHCHLHSSSSYISSYPFFFFKKTCSSAALFVPRKVQCGAGDGFEPHDPYPSASEDFELDNQRLHESLLTLSNSLSKLGAVLEEVVSAVALVAEAIHPKRERSETIKSNLSEVRKDGGGIPSHLVQRNALAHKLAYSLQQAFVQARIEGLGKPFEVAAEDFVDACLQACKGEIKMEELQLQLILADGALKGAFSLASKDPLDGHILDEENRIRLSWVRYVYKTVLEVEKNSGMQIHSNAQDMASFLEEKAEQLDPLDLFVKEVIDRAMKEGYNLERLKLEQKYAGEATSGALKALRQSNFIVLLALQKVKDSI
ncbi:hypothetical protein O6H91_12G087200 [Diphasiastrum complanatum]|uniref:Uncharacterized protein n=2 Tax=Diphasiastrum complanatum TaxID=34168 RepID=A0ACC2C4C1_DIPCM|nr:hypothetical protein O6H91_12G087200 [Diphasiastrum complanatum]KAJ7536894.1 hypothetical protein O6H91_12G087200 [Diphasiastrum complanatum]